MLVLFSLIISTLSSLMLIPFCQIDVTARTLEVGAGHTYATPTAAAQNAIPGDTILLYDVPQGVTQYITGLQGTASAWITMRSADTLNHVVLNGGTEAMHFTDCRYLRLEHMTVTGQTGNGVNIDDGGSPETPSHHIIVSRMVFRDMNATGNNDLLKMSGIDSFQVVRCTFENGAEGGSGIDMVGCHFGTIERCRFENLGSNAIQAKGGSGYLLIVRNWFEDAGQRAVNLGGSTGLQFFRPIDAPYEAADIGVFANVFVRSVTPIAYVGSTRVDVAHNTIISPERWVMRILQETVDTTRFVKCGDNLFRNNLVYMTGLAGTHVNVGPNTAPETFGFQTNLWYDATDPSRSAPSLPTPEAGGIRGSDPLLENVAEHRYTPRTGSPAVAAGTTIPGVSHDFTERAFNNPPTIGAFEAGVPSGVHDAEVIEPSGLRHPLVLSPNPASDVVNITNPKGRVRILDVQGTTLLTTPLDQSLHEASGTTSMSVSGLPAGMYIVQDDQSSAVLIITR